MPLARYQVTSGTLRVKATSSVHDTTTVWTKLDGEVEANADTLATTGAHARVRIAMNEFDAGDWLKNKKLRADYAMDAHPEASFELGALTDVVRTGDQFSAAAKGLLRWRGRAVPLSFTGTGDLSASEVYARARFRFDIRELGLRAPKVLLFKVDDVVEVEIEFRGRAIGTAP